MKSGMLWLVCFAFCMLAFPAIGSAQGCKGVMTPEYSTYTTFALDQSLHIYSTFAVDGTTIIGNTEYCNISGTTHRGSAYNKLGSVGGTIYSPPVPPASYLGVSNPQEIVGVPGVVYVDSTQGYVICSSVGTLFSASLNISIKIGITDFILEGWDTNNCTYMMYCPNGYNAASCPAAQFVDLDGMHEIPPCNKLNYSWVYSLVVNGKCLPVSFNVLSTVPASCQ